MKIILDANPSDAPGCVKVIAKPNRKEYRNMRRAGQAIRDGEEFDELIQVDYERINVASFFGWSTAHSPGGSTLDFEPGEDAECPGMQFTDGTVKCPICGKEAGDFITEAIEFIDNNDGKVIRIPTPTYAWAFNLPNEFRFGRIDDKYG